MPEKADISRTLLLPFMSIILLVAVYMTANVLLPLKASGKGSKESEDVLCQITIPQIYDGGNYGIVSSVYQGTPANVTLEYRDNGTVEAEDVTATGEQNSEMEMQDDGVTEVVDQYDTTEQISTYQEESMLIQEGYVKPQFSTYDEVVKLYRDVIKAGGDYEQMLAAGLTNLEICARAYKDSNDALSRFGYCYIDLDNDAKMN